MYDSLPFGDLMYWAAFLASTILFYLTAKLKLNSEDDWINGFRKAVFPLVHPIASKYGQYTVAEIDEEQFVGYINESVDEIERRFDTMGGERNFAACLKVEEDGDYEASSYAFRTSQHEMIPDRLSLKQLHVILFRVNSGKTAVYAHWEFNSLLPLVGLWHYRAKNFNAQKGINKFKKLWAEHYPETVV